MKFERDPALEDELLDDMINSFYEPDRHQPSVSGMIQCITRTYWENEVKMDNKPPLSRRETQLFAVGLALERVMLGARQRALKGEYDGIQWHVDHIGTDQDFIEFKSTRINMVDDNEPKVSDKWQKQVLAYFKALGLTEGHFVMLHIMGDRKPPFPDVRAYRVITTQDEIDANWAWLKQRAISYLTAVQKQIPPTPFEWNEEWECKDCPWYGLCLARKIQDANDAA